jgi:uncharacterized protein (TIGR00255 family)
MTGYAAASGRNEETAVTITVKSVNHRFLDLHLRLPPELEPLEPKVRRLAREHLRRGHLDVTVMLERDGGVEVHIDRGLVKAYLEAYNRLRSEFGLTAEADLNAVLKVPGALVCGPAMMGDAESRELETLVMKTFAEALGRLDAMRTEEAEAIACELRSRLAEIRRATGEIERLRDGAAGLYLERLRQRLAELMADQIPVERLAQEAALLAERSDVSEELLRMKSHLQQFEVLLESGSDSGEAGKRLDFLLQEMGRESNTILSKTSGLGEVGIRITGLGLRVKAEIEKLREQVQNLQ